MLLAATLFALASCGYDEADIPVFYIKNGTEANDPADEMVDNFYSTFYDEDEPYEPKQTEEVTVPDISYNPTDDEISENAGIITPRDTAPDDIENTVYWVSGGEVWHVTDKCSSLSRSKKILSGTVEDAVLAGKTRVCKKCGK